MKGGGGAPTTPTRKPNTPPPPPRAHVPLMWPRLGASTSLPTNHGRPSVSPLLDPDIRVSFRLPLAIPSVLPLTLRATRPSTHQEPDKARYLRTDLATPGLTPAPRKITEFAVVVPCFLTLHKYSRCSITASCTFHLLRSQDFVVASSELFTSQSYLISTKGERATLTL